MEEIVTCNICAQQFDSLHYIPKMLECGHTFCSPCLTKVFRENPICPNCRTEIKGVESSLPINYAILNAVDIYKSKNWSESEIVTSIEDMKKKCMEGIDELSKKKTQITLSLEIFEECLAKLNELTVSESFKVDSLNAKKILNKLQDKLRKTDLVMPSDDIKSSVSIRLSSFEDSEAYLTEIFKRIQNEEKVFAVHKIIEEVKYGEISLYENKLFFHSLSLSEAPKDSSLIWFDELKQCANDENFFTFIKICCNDKKVPRVLIIKMFDKQMSHHFIKLCTGEYGPSYKGTSYERGQDYGVFSSILKVKNFVENCRETNRVIDFNFYIEGYNYNLGAGEIYLKMRNLEGDFGIAQAKEIVKAESDVIGRIISPTKLKGCINYDHSSFLKIINSGIIIEV